MDFSDEMIDEILKIFQVESEEIISRLNHNILDLEKNPNNKDTILLLFRDAHSLKGASRMVGFNNVQTLAHKMEDLLGLAKENKLSFNSNVVGILYKTVDFLSELIQKSIQKGQEIYSEDIAAQISILDKINENPEIANVKNNDSDFDSEYFLQNIEKINSLIPEALFLLMKIGMKKNNALIAKLLDAINELYNIFNTCEAYDIRKPFEDLKVKLEFTIKGSNSLTVEETEEIQSTLNNIINKLISIYELYNIELIDYYSIAFEKMSEHETDETPQIEVLQAEDTTEVFQSEPEFFTEEKNRVYADLEEEKSEEITISLIKDEISNLLTNTGSLSKIKKSLNTYEESCEIEDAKNILQKISRLLDFAGTNEIQLNEEMISVLTQSLEYCDDAIHEKSEIADKALVSQRLEIIQQVLEFNREKTEVEIFINPKEEKSRKITDFSEVFNTNEIKTLRVDSTKLDTLVNQVNDLTVSKIKTKKHLFELDSINKEVEDWQKSLIKVLNYLKYYDKKQTQSGINDNQNSFLTKQLLNLFNENNKKVQKISSNLANLHRTIQEDEVKTSLLVDNLNNMVKNIRVLPLATVFHLFGRMVRDIAEEKNKKIDFEITGSETSTDKKIIEEIKTPLIHIIRNAIDHGIETPDERISLGKNPVGKIVLAARQSNNKVIIEIKDDGRGINLAKLKEKAIQKNFLTEEEIKVMSDEQIMNIIFAPGFSTGDEVTNISGRGIGLDVVQSKIAQLNGKVSVISEFNKGCCVQIELPTTMSIMNVFLVKAANQTFAIPIEAINNVLRKNNDEIISNQNKKTIIFKGETMPLYDLSDILNIPKSTTCAKKITVIVLEHSNRLCAISVDSLIGEQEILHKKLSAPLYKIKNISGITTLMSGEVCLILNISDIVKKTNIAKSYISTSLQNKKAPSEFKILLVDDSATTRTLEKNILKKVGYQIEIAENPIEAFEKMKNNNFDLIISDVEMPEMNGLQFLEKLKTDEMFSEIPVIIVSSLTSSEQKTLAIELGAEKYIVKSEFNQEELQDVVASILNR